MSALYIHVPFCAKACDYCNFHFSTTTKHLQAMVDAISKEIFLRRDYLDNKPLRTIYFGGGTPSILTIDQIEQIFESIGEHFILEDKAEITLEANPENLNTAYLTELKRLGINRLSVGVQSFSDDYLSAMGRNHSASTSRKALHRAGMLFDNISIDLIYGFPDMSDLQWVNQIREGLSFNVSHVSAYALTVEPKTALKNKIHKKRYPPIDDANSKSHYFKLVELLETKGFIRYEFSNFGKTGYFSRANRTYWEGGVYLGVGPSAHSYDGKIRSWNISNNIKYIENISCGKLPQEIEFLSTKDHYNEYIMTRLRTTAGVDLLELEKRFGKEALEYFLQNAKRNTAIRQNDKRAQVDYDSYFLIDGISADLFMV